MSRPPENPVKRLVGEIHRRSLWQVLAIYVVSGGVVYEAVQSLTEGLGLPGWFPALAFILLLIGLPVVLATAFVQEGGPGGGPSEPAAEPEETASVADTGDEPAAQGIGAVFTWRNAMVGGVLAFALWGVVAAGWLVLGSGGGATASDAPATEEEGASIAVLPFDNLSPDPENAFFASGIHEEILTHVSRIIGLKVISRTSVLEYRETEKNLRTIATELGVDHVLEGSVRRAGNRLRIAAQLIDARSDAHLWSETYDRTYTVDEVFAVQTDVAERIARSLNATLSPDTRRAMSSGTTHDREAFDLFLRARDRANEATRRSWDEATELLVRAVSLDPGFVRAWALLSTVHAGMYWFGYDRTGGRLGRSEEALEAARALDPDHPDTRLAAALYHYWGHRDYDRALAELAAAQERLEGTSDYLLVLAAIQRRKGDFERAARNFTRAFELAPRSAVLAANVAFSLLALGRFGEALEYWDRALELGPDEADLHARKAQTLRLLDGSTERARAALRGAMERVDSARLWRAWWELELHDRDPAAAMRWARLAPEGPVASQYGSIPKAYYVGEALHRSGDVDRARPEFEEARRTLERAVREDPANETAPFALSRVYARLGMAEEAIATARAALERFPPEQDLYVGPQGVESLARVQMILGRPDSALAALSRYLAFPGYRAYPLEDPFWDPLRDDPRFQALLEEHESER